jgi:hypothetical protein
LLDEEVCKVACHHAYLLGIDEPRNTFQMHAPAQNVANS